MLSKVQSREFSRFKKLADFFEKNETIIAAYDPFAEEVDSFTTNFTFFQDNIPDKGGFPTGITAGQRELKAKIGGQVAAICTPACSYAIKYNNPKLQAEMCHSKSDITSLKDADVLGTVLGISKAITPLLQDAGFIKYKITQGMLTAAEADATTFNGNIGKADLEDNGNTIANKNINEAISLLRANIRQLNRLINWFAAAHPGFVAGYKINSAVDNTGVHHSGIEGIILSDAAGKPIKDARIDMKDLRSSAKPQDKRALSNITGNYELVKMRAGEYEVTFSAAGYTAKTMTMRIEQGKIKKVDVML
jgi:5-hydroxyisourate hydrolase-like protein (transthyretin family)